MHNKGGITVSYFGVHQAYQLALAAQEIGKLDAFYCSLYDSPRKWGGLVSRLVGQDKLVNRRCEGLDPAAAIELPIPLLRERITSRFVRKNGKEWVTTARLFDTRVANLLENSRSRLFIGVENCAAESFRVAAKLGMRLVYDCPGFNPEISDQVALIAAREWNLPRPEPSDSAKTKAQKEEELSLAEYVLVYSEVHQQSWEKRGVNSAKFVHTPLWIEPSLWWPKPEKTRMPGPLRVLYAGRGSLMKGVPYLLDAIKQCGKQAHLDCVGSIEAELQPLLAGLSNVQLFPSVSKAELREIYWSHDLLVLPSLGDSFGFVALEAMACGLPVIVTENCGVPVPDRSWRVPVIDSRAIALRLMLYANNTEALLADGQIAVEFAKQFTVERYRNQVKQLLRRLLEE